MTRFITMLAIAGTVLIISCGSPGEDTSTDTGTTPNTTETGNTAEPINQNDNNKLTNSNSQEGDNKLLESKSYSNIAAFLPKEANGVEGGPFEGWTSEGKRGAKFTLAKRSYKNPENKTRIDVTISDAGSQTLKSLGLNTYWSGKTIDEKSEKGYEKTSKFGDYPAFEKCNGRSCDFGFTVGERFLISGYTEKVSLEELQKILKTIDIEALKKLPK